MKNKRILLLLIAVLIMVLLALFFIVKNFNKENLTEENIIELTPEEEISSKQLRETIVTLYFLDKDSGTLKNEGKLIDSKELLNNPYKKITELLLLGPQNDNLISVFPENTKILDSEINSGCVTLNFSEELLNYSDEVQKNNIINALLKTLTELNEVDSIKILINNEAKKEFN